MHQAQGIAIVDTALYLWIWLEWKCVQLLDFQVGNVCFKETAKLYQRLDLNLFWSGSSLPNYLEHCLENSQNIGDVEEINSADGAEDQNWRDRSKRACHSKFSGRARGQGQNPILNSHHFPRYLKLPNPFLQEFCTSEKIPCSWRARNSWHLSPPALSLDGVAKEGPSFVALYPNLNTPHYWLTKFVYFAQALSKFSTHPHPQLYFEYSC